MKSIATNAKLTLTEACTLGIKMVIFLILNISIDIKTQTFAWTGLRALRYQARQHHDQIIN